LPKPLSFPEQPPNTTGTVLTVDGGGTA